MIHRKMKMVIAVVLIVSAFCASYYFTLRGKFLAKQEVSTSSGSPQPEISVSTSPTPSPVNTRPISPSSRPVVSSVPSRAPIPTTTPTPTTFTLNVTVMSGGYQCPGCKVRKYYTSSPTGQYNDYQVNVNGSYELTYDASGTYYVMAYHPSQAQNTAGQSVFVNGAQSITLTLPSIQTSPQPSPDTQSPVVDAINGPFDWSGQGICFTINGDQIHDNNGGPYAFSWQLGTGPRPPYIANETIKCFQSLTTGSYTVSLQAKDAAGNFSNTVSRTFSMPL